MRQVLGVLLSLALLLGPAGGLYGQVVWLEWDEEFDPAFMTDGYQVQGCQVQASGRCDWLDLPGGFTPATVWVDRAVVPGLTYRYGVYGLGRRLATGEGLRSELSNLVTHTVPGGRPPQTIPLVSVQVQP